MSLTEAEAARASVWKSYVDQGAEPGSLEVVLP